MIDNNIPGWMNLRPITAEILQAAFDELIRYIPGVAKSDGIVAGTVLRHTYKSLIKRGLLNEMGVVLLKEELKRIEDMNVDHKH